MHLDSFVDAFVLQFEMVVDRSNPGDAVVQMLSSNKQSSLRAQYWGS